MSLSSKISTYFAHSLKSRGYTQEGLEKKLHMSQATLSDLCNDRCRWNARHLERIAPVFGQTPGEFVTAAEAYRPQRAKKTASVASARERRNKQGTRPA